MSLRVYTYRGCSTCSKALRYLRDRGLAFEEIAIRETPPSIDELRRMLAAYDGKVRALCNTAGRDYRELNMKERLPQMSEAEVLELLQSNGNLIKRPFVIGDDIAVVGFKPDTWDALWK